MNRTLLRRPGVVIAAIVAAIAVVVVSVIVATSGGGKTYHLTAYFSSTVGLYQGNDVRVLGVSVGRIDSITPDGPQVKVVMSYDGATKIPAAAAAVIITPSIVSDRYIQLTPGYTGGATLPNHAVLGLRKTRVPIELDQLFGNLNKLDVALGPNGANHDGALSRLVATGARNLRGNGTHFNRTVRAFSAALSTLSGSRRNLFATVNHLQRFTTVLATHDGGVRALNHNLAKVGGQLAGERDDLGAALVNLSTALDAVNTFVSANRQSLTTSIHGLAKVTNVLSKEKEAITQITDETPLALSDVSLTYDPRAKTLDTRSDAPKPVYPGGPSGAICQLLSTVGLGPLLDGVDGCFTPSSKTAVSTTTKHPTSLADLLGVRP